MFIYLLDKDNIFTHTEDIDPIGSIPKNACFTSPPGLSGTQVAHYTPEGWQVYADRDAVPPTPPAPVPVPDQLTRRQALQMLRLAGFTKDNLIGQLNLLYASNIEKRDLAIIELEESQVFERHRPLTLLMGAAIGLDSAGVDQLFINGSKL